MQRPQGNSNHHYGLPDYSMMVLLVDDQAMIGEAVRRALSEESDIDFHFCSDPHQALSVAQQIKPTVILQDLIMPGVAGTTAAYRKGEVRLARHPEMPGHHDALGPRRDLFHPDCT